MSDHANNINSNDGAYCSSEMPLFYDYDGGEVYEEKTYSESFVDKFVDYSRFSYLLVDPKIPKIEPDIVIKKPIIVIYNPAAGNGKPIKYVAEFQKAISELPEENQPKVHILQTLENPETRIDAIVKYVNDLASKDSIYQDCTIVGFGGDRTGEDVTEVALKLQKLGIKTEIVYARGGTAGDIANEMNMPRNPKELLRAIASGERIKLNIVGAKINGEGPVRKIVHSQGNGCSGAFFSEVENAAKMPRGRTIETYFKAFFRPGPYLEEVNNLAKVPRGKNLTAYIIGLVKGVLNADTFYVSVNGETPMPTGEALTLTYSTSVGKIGKVQLPAEAGQLHVVPVIPGVKGPARLIPGVANLLEGILNNIRYYFGDQSPLVETKLSSLPEARVFEIHPQTELNLEFLDAKGNSKSVHGVINGDAVLNIKNVQLFGTDETVNVVVAKDSAILVRRGIIAPTSVTSSFSRSVKMFVNSTEFSIGLFLMGALEIYKDYAGFTPEEKSASDRLALATALLFDGISLRLYGATPFFMQLPFIIPFFGSGQVVASKIVNDFAEENDIETFKTGHSGNTIAGIAGGSMTAYGAIRYFGIDLFEAGAKSVNSFLVKNLSKEALVSVISVAKTFLINASKFIGSIRPIFPIVMIIPPDFEKFNINNEPEIT